MLIYSKNIFQACNVGPCVKKRKSLKDEIKKAKEKFDEKMKLKADQEKSKKENKPEL